MARVIYDPRLELPPPVRIDGDLPTVLLENARARKRERQRTAVLWLACAVVAAVIGSLVTTWVMR